MPVKGADMSSMVIELIEDAETALLERGLSALDPVRVHRDFRWITSTGEVLDAEQGRRLIDRQTVEELHVRRLAPDAVVVTSLCLARAGGRTRRASAWAQVKPSRWQLYLHQATGIGAAMPACRT
jgi:hypothetical protein